MKQKGEFFVKNIISRETQIQKNENKIKKKLNLINTEKSEKVIITEKKIKNQQNRSTMLVVKFRFVNLT
jgi:hypothetical protein